MTSHIWKCHIVLIFIVWILSLPPSVAQHDPCVFGDKRPELRTLVIQNESHTFFCGLADMTLGVSFSPDGPADGSCCLHQSVYLYLSASLPFIIFCLEMPSRDPLLCCVHNWWWCVQCVLCGIFNWGAATRPSVCHALHDCGWEMGSFWVIADGMHMGEVIHQ